MAKALRFLALAPTDDGIRLTFERLGERFTFDVPEDGMATFMSLWIGTMAQKGAVFRMPVAEIAFQDTPDVAGQPPVLIAAGDGGIIGLDLTWSMVTGLSQTATEMLRHAPSEGRPS